MGVTCLKESVGNLRIGFVAEFAIETEGDGGPDEEGLRIEGMDAEGEHIEKLNDQNPGCGVAELIAPPEAAN
jgi:hypothetical protein